MSERLWGFRFVAACLAAAVLVLWCAAPSLAAERHVRGSGATAAFGALEPVSDSALPVAVVMPGTTTAGSVAGLIIHTKGPAHVGVVVTYASGLQRRVTGTTGSAGVTRTLLPVPGDLALLGPAVVQVQVTHAGHDAFWQGTLWVNPPAAPSVQVSPQALRLLAGYHARVVIATVAGATIHYSAGFTGGEVLASGTTVADSAGHALVTFATPASLRTPASVWITASATTAYATGTGSTSLILVPRLAPSVAVTASTAAVDAGHQETILVRSMPSAQLGISINYGSGPIEHRLGQVGVDGRYSFTITTPAGITRTQTVSVVVRALSNGATGQGSTAFTMRPAPPTTPDYSKSLRPSGDFAAGTPSYARYTVGKVILVSLNEQVLRAYADGKLLLTTYVTTGRPELPTIQGVFHIYEKVTPFEFHSPWPKGSPFYYVPTKIQYWMPFSGGYGLHDAWWRSAYGPGSNLPQGSVTGSHGCVNIPFWATQWIWNWAPVGTTVIVY